MTQDLINEIDGLFKSVFKYYQLNDKDAVKVQWNSIIKELEQTEVNKLSLGDVMPRLLTDKQIWEWWETQKFQKEDGEQEYTMLFECDLPKILKAFSEHLLND